MKKLGRVIVFLLVAAATAGGTWWAVSGPEKAAQGGGHSRRGSGSDGPVSITATAAKTSDVPIYLEGVGTVKARNTVTVRPQVDGRILSINFTEGQNVAKGDLLLKIDPATYQAQLDQAVAKKALDEALLSNTKRDLVRYETVGTLAQSQQQIDTQRALVKQQEAQVQGDQAAIENATAFLNYTSIVSPINGRTGIRQVDEGNLIRNGDTTGIVVITEVQPISIVFTLPQQQLEDIRKGEAAGQLSAVALSTGGRKELDKGVMQVIDNQIDPTTGTVRLKAEFPNANLQLWPGQFVNVRLLVNTLNHVVTVPSQSIQRGPSNSTFVYVVNGDSVAMKTIKIGQQTEAEAIVTDGLAEGDMVVTAGFGRLSDGAKVALAGDNAEPATPATAPSSDAKEKGHHKHHRDNASIAP